MATLLIWESSFSGLHRATISCIQASASQGQSSVLFQLLIESGISILVLAVVIFLFFRWLEASAPKRMSVQVCMYCGSRALNVSNLKDAAGRDTAFCYCTNCKRYFSLDLAPR